MWPTTTTCASHAVSCLVAYAVVILTAGPIPLQRQHSFSSICCSSEVCVCSGWAQAEAFVSKALSHLVYKKDALTMDGSHPAAPGTRGDCCRTPQTYFCC